MTSIDDYGYILARKRELVDEANWPDMERAYTRVSGKKWQRAHALNIDHMMEGIREVINKNSGEIALKKFGQMNMTHME